MKKKKRFSAVILCIILVFSMMTGTTFAADNPAAVQTQDVQTASPEKRVWDLSSDDTAVRPTVQGATGEYEGIIIDAINGKFAPRTPETGGADTQVNSGTILTIPLEANSSGGTLTIKLSGGSATVESDGTEYTSENSAVSIPVAASETDTTCVVSFVSQAYLASIELSYTEPEEEYPGIPENVDAADTTYTFESTDGLLTADGAAPADATLQGIKGTFQDIKVDAVSGKFAVQTSSARVQINAGTVLYIPAAYDEKGATLQIAGTSDGSTPSSITVNGENYTTNTLIDLDMSDASAYPQYIAVAFTEQSYVTQIAVNYASDSDFGTPDVTATDKIWDFTESSSVERPNLQGNIGEFDGIQIDATLGKFAPRTSASGGNDTQVTAGTILYIPAAPDIQGASITISGNNYNNLTVLLDGTEITVGKETALPEVTENTYIPLEFISADGSGSCYLTGITVDYMSDNEASANIVTVGSDGTYDYTSIQSALDANESSAAEPLIILIAPGTYTEKITVDKPWVSFQPLYKDGGEIIIEESYYSSNTFNSDGTFIPQDDYDLGTDQCGTVLLTGNATGFSASGITFQNSYNVTDHTGAGEQTPAVAFGSAADKVYLKDCKFIGRQDTLYLHGSGSRVQVENCYIEGTVDFVFGDADAYFINTELHMAAFAGRDTGYFTAANTKKGNIGFVFYNCNLTVDSSYGADSTVSLGRPWQTECDNVTIRDDSGNSYMTEYNPDRKHPQYENTSSAATFIECTMDSAIQNERWNVWTRKDQDGVQQDVTYHEDVRFSEINSKDETGAYLNPEDYSDIVLGSMEIMSADEATSTLSGLLAQMGFGTGVGSWNPTFTDYSTTAPEVTPPSPGEGTETPGQGTGDNADTNTDSSNSIDTTDAVRTGDTSDIFLWVVVLAIAGSLFGTLKLRSRRS